jgi:hypothetical protein
MAKVLLEASDVAPMAATAARAKMVVRFNTVSSPSFLLLVFVFGSMLPSGELVEALARRVHKNRKKYRVSCSSSIHFRSALGEKK